MGNSSSYEKLHKAKVEAEATTTRGELGPPGRSESILGEMVIVIPRC